MVAPVMGIAKFDRFFRAAAGLDVDKEDLKRYSDFVNRKIYDLLLVAQANARANEHDLVEPHDLPITKGLQETIHQFREMDEGLEIEPILEHLATLPPLDIPADDTTRAQLRLLLEALGDATDRNDGVDGVDGSSGLERLGVERRGAAGRLRARSGLARLMSGSVGAGIVYCSPSPVLIVGRSDVA